MSDIFKTTLSLSCSGALLIAVLCVFYPLCRGKLSKQWQYYIWLVVIARLLLPFAPETNLIGTFFQRIDNGIVHMQSALRNGQDILSLPTSNEAYMESEQNNLHQEEFYAENYKNKLWIVWFMVMIVLLIRKVTIYQSFVKYIRAGCVEVADIDLLERFGSLVEQSRVKPTVELYTNNLISSPLLIGFFKPCIVLPTTELSANDFSYTILHELIHFKRHDMFYKWLVQITVCVHWFNPLVYLMSNEVERSCELSCDEVVIMDLNMSERRAYGDTLMNAIAAGGCYKDSISSVTLCENKERVKERLDAILNFRKKSKYILSFLLTIAICLGAVAMGAYAAQPLSASNVVAKNKPKIIGNLTLIEKEYTLEELKELGIAGVVVNTLSDRVEVVRGQDTLKFEYYAENQEEYIQTKEIDHSTNRWKFCLRRIEPSDLGDGRNITITVPEQFQIQLLDICTTSGNIIIKDFNGDYMQATTQNGQIAVQGGLISKGFHIETETSNAIVSGTTLPIGDNDGSYPTVFNTKSGSILFQPVDSADNYCFSVDYGEEAQVTFNGEIYDVIDTEVDYEVLDNSASETNADDAADGFMVKPIQTVIARKSKFTIHEGAGTKIYFNSPKGSLNVQEK